MREIQTDLLVIGGGINGSGIAVDAAGRGLKVVLCEMNDLASGTSSWSSKLVHGGLRYLEQYEFKLVKEALRERDVLINKAPHIIHPLTFVLPHDKHLRPQWMIRCGMFLYDFLAGRKMQFKKSKKVSLLNTIEGSALKEKYKVGFSYSDCRIDDARMVVLNALQAQELGADVLVQTKCISAHREAEGWRAILKSKSGEEICVRAKAVVNASGPWVAKILHDVVETDSKSQVRLIKGSHIVVPKLYEGEHAYILQNKDNRIVFAIPYGFTAPGDNEFTLIGTTDVNYEGDPAKVKISMEERVYICDLINEYFEHQVTPEEIVWEYSGVRPLYDDNSDDPSKNTREYHFEKEDVDGKGLLLSIFGGKITTFRTLSEKAMVEVSHYFKDLKEAWTADKPLPGGEVANQSEIILNIEKAYPWLDKKLAFRFATTYGSRTEKLLQDSKSMEDLGQCFGYNLYQKEVDYLVKEEWATDVESIVWRRTKLGLWLTTEEQDQLAVYLDSIKSH
ncbi:glycerol-3-phosphate dehydrogenase [Francisellaceae bacterium]|nr:glycerol-3-phosphate dehydrogenase [Francisellaceae bacterium]